MPVSFKLIVTQEVLAASLQACEGMFLLKIYFWHFLFYLNSAV